MAKKWIQSAIKHKGALTNTAKAQGKTVSELCSGKVSGVTAKRCALAKTLGKMHK